MPYKAWHLFYIILYMINDLPSSVEDMVELNQRFTSQRSTLPSMFVVTPYDLRTISNTEDPADKDKRYKLASHWTCTTPSLQILYRSKQLASAALGFLSANLTQKTVDIKVQPNR